MSAGHIWCEGDLIVFRNPIEHLAITYRHRDVIGAMTLTGHMYSWTTVDAFIRNLALRNGVRIGMIAVRDLPTDLHARRRELAARIRAATYDAP